MHLDIFNDDAFSVSSLTAAINEQPHQPGRIGALGLFQEEGVTTTSVTIEYNQGGLSLVPVGERGKPVSPQERDQRNLRSFVVPHLKKDDTLLADAIQNLRAFGSETDVETVQNVVNQRLGRMNRDLDATIEFHRVGAIKGLILDADGSSVIYDLYDEFGIVQEEVSLALGNAATNVRNKILEAVRKSEDKLGATVVSGYRIFFGRALFDAFTGHAKVEKAWERWNEGEMLRNDPRGGFMFGGAFCEEYRGKVGTQAFIGDNEAYLVPEGVADLFITRFAPADYMETANTLGLPKYAKQEMLRMNRGVEFEAQSNPLNLCTRPGAIIKLTA
ncbi:major capsid protein [Pseudomonas sp. LMG 31766]|uniref:Major capsid protein n=1 Tax=Pseudomonas chaetocerotis TaxID=2758695 RepID=A0A931GEM3_9PSED|nr:major capsid protein [Pseudomonas chaetocerotis]MBZ9665747.1 major capsid protein [Pseudomonas chaetocerotis]